MKNFPTGRKGLGSVSFGQEGRIEDSGPGVQHSGPQPGQGTQCRGPFWWRASEVKIERKIISSVADPYPAGLPEPPIFGISGSDSYTPPLLLRSFTMHYVFIYYIIITELP